MRGAREISVTSFAVCNNKAAGVGALRVISRDRQATLRDTCFQVNFLPSSLPEPRTEVRLNSSPVTEIFASVIPHRHIAALRHDPD